MSRAEEQVRLAQLRELGPTPPDYDGPGSVRPATLEQCWRLIEELDREALAEGSVVGAHTRLVRDVGSWPTRCAPKRRLLRGCSRDRQAAHRECERALTRSWPTGWTR